MSLCTAPCNGNKLYYSWSRAYCPVRYERLEANLPKMLMQHTDCPFSDDEQLFPSHAAITEYLERYADEVCALSFFSASNSYVISSWPSWVLSEAPSYYKQLTLIDWHPLGPPPDSFRNTSDVRLSSHITLNWLVCIDSLARWWSGPNTRIRRCSACERPLCCSFYSWSTRY